MKTGLPYAFTRHGVEIRTNAIEFNGDGQLLVNVMLQEQRGVSVELSLDRLIEARTSTGQILSYLQSRRGDQISTEPLLLKAHEQMPVTLVFQPPLSAQDVATELHFPTGKWWSSSTQE